jgi:hypothetical protein
MELYGIISSLVNMDGSRVMFQTRAEKVSQEVNLLQTTFLAPIAKNNEVAKREP